MISGVGGVDTGLSGVGIGPVITGSPLGVVSPLSAGGTLEVANGMFPLIFCHTHGQLLFATIISTNTEAAIRTQPNVPIFTLASERSGVPRRLVRERTLSE